MLGYTSEGCQNIACVSTHCKHYSSVLPKYGLLLIFEDTRICLGGLPEHYMCPYSTMCIQYGCCQSSKMLGHASEACQIITCVLKHCKHYSSVSSEYGLLPTFKDTRIRLGGSPQHHMCPHNKRRAALFMALAQAPQGSWLSIYALFLDPFAKRHPCTSLFVVLSCKFCLRQARVRTEVVSLNHDGTRRSRRCHAYCTT